jgi:hypothetical protein
MRVSIEVPETSEINYQHMPLNIPEDRKPLPNFNPDIRCVLTTVFQFLNVYGTDRSREKWGHGRKRSG